MKTSNIDVVCLAATLMRVQAQVSSALTVGQSGHRASIACQLNAFLSINNLTAAIKILLLALIAAIAAGSALAQNWVWTSAPHENWSSAASSSDGMKLVAVVNGGGIWASTDSGTNWTQTSAPSTNWTSVASSSDGSKLIAAASVGGIWVSTDSGTNWTQTSAPNTNWASVASSADGSRLIAGGSGNTYISTNLGAAWTPTAISNIPFVFSSTNGTKLLVINGSSIYMSTNFGITWTSNSAPIGFSAVATSSDCNKVFGVCNGCEQNYISTNSGTTWAQINTGGDQGWISAASSADGNELLEGTFAFLIWASADSGTTWAPTHTPATVWPSIAASADGTTWVALVPGGGDGGIWTWHTTVPVISSQPTSQIVPGGINVKLGVILFGVTPLSYQWQLDGTNLPGETNAMLTLTNVNLSNSGSYVLIITNRFGSIASSNALVTVFPALLTTQPASGISATNAELNGLITPGLNDTVVWLEWGTTVNYGNVTPPMDMGESSNQLYFSSLVTGLTPNTVYHCQAVASNALGLAFGGDVNFETSPLFAQTSATNINWTSIACSADGTKIVAESSGVGIWISTNAGGTWMQTSAPNTNWVCVVSSADGTKLAAPADSTIYTSTNSGATWTPNNTPTSFSFVASSADGDQLVGLGGGHVYTSTNAGATWTQTSAPSSIYGSSLDWTSAASTADGTKLTASAFYFYRGNMMPSIYISTNSGGSWNSVFSTVYEDLSYITASADGNKIFATGWWGHIYSSTDSGVTWVWGYGPVDQLGPIVSSADGTKLIVISSRSEALKTSVDSGVTWVQASTPPYVNWNCIASSADGNELIAGGNGGIYISKSTTPPALNIAASNKLTLSWLMPSANFVLQQNSDLLTANWTDVTNTPILNLTNLQNQVFLPMSVRSSFYRLATP